MIPLAYSGSVHDNSMVVEVISCEERFNGFVGAENNEQK